MLTNHSNLRKDLTFSIFAGIGKIYYGILGAALGAAFGTALFGIFDYLFNKKKNAEHYALPLTLQAAYIKGSFQVDLNSITEILLGKNNNSFIYYANYNKRINKKLFVFVF